MQQHPLTLISHTPSGLMAAVTPKCGSTSMISLFLHLAGLPKAAARPRNFLRRADATAVMAAQGLTIKDGPASMIDAARRAHPELRLIGVTRDPYTRLVSGYHSKINRYTKRFARSIYILGKLGQFCEGPDAWPDGTFANRHMQRFLPFAAFVAGLERHGIGFDLHFAPQAELLDYPQHQYDHLFRLEDLQTELTPQLAAMGIEAHWLTLLSTLPRANATAAAKRHNTLLTADLRARIARLYAVDFQAFRYPL
jgi:hypothetical protein